MNTSPLIKSAIRQATVAIPTFDLDPIIELIQAGELNAAADRAQEWAGGTIMRQKINAYDFLARALRDPIEQLAHAQANGATSAVIELDSGEVEMTIWEALTILCDLAPGEGFVVKSTR